MSTSEIPYNDILTWMRENPDHDLVRARKCYQQCEKANLVIMRMWSKQVAVVKETRELLQRMLNSCEHQFVSEAPGRCQKCFLGWDIMEPDFLDEVQRGLEDAVKSRSDLHDGIINHTLEEIRNEIALLIEQGRSSGPGTAPAGTDTDK